MRVRFNKERYNGYEYHARMILLFKVGAIVTKELLLDFFSVDNY